MKAWMMTADARNIRAVTRYEAPMPLSISRVERRRAPATETAAA